MPDMNSADMKKHLSDPRLGGIVLPDGRVITNPREIPGDDELKKMREEAKERNKGR